MKCAINFIPGFLTMELVVAGSCDSLGCWSVAPAESRNAGLQTEGGRTEEALSRSSLSEVRLPNGKALAYTSVGRV